MTDAQPDELTGHSGELAVHVARAHGVETMFTLSGAHVFPMYDGARSKADPPMRLLDVRHEQTAAFAAEATGKLTRVPGPRRADRRPRRHQRHQRDRAGPVRRLPDGRGRRPRPAEPLGHRQRSRSSTSRRSSRPVAKAARTITTAGEVAAGIDEAFTLARSSPPRPGLRRRPDGRVLQLRVRRVPARASRHRGVEPDGDAIAAIAGLLARAQRPVLILGTDVWADRAEAAALRFVEDLGIPTITNGMGRGVIPGGHRCWSPRPAARPSTAPTWSSSSAPRSTSASATASSAARTSARPPSPGSSTSPTPPARSPATPSSPRSVAGDLTDGPRRPRRRRSSGGRQARLVGVGRPSCATR